MENLLNIVSSTWQEKREANVYRFTSLLSCRPMALLRHWPKNTACKIFLFFRGALATQKYIPRWVPSILDQDSIVSSLQKHTIPCWVTFKNVSLQEVLLCISEFWSLWKSVSCILGASYFYKRCSIYDIFMLNVIVNYSGSRIMQHIMSFDPKNF